jgi:hypothetical protein
MAGQLKFAVALVAMIAAGIGYAAEEAGVIRLSEPVEVTADAETFGSPLDQSVPAVALRQIAADAEDYIGAQVRVEARVSQVCRKKGCFFIARDGASMMRVSFKDYGFFVPTDISGKTVTLVGRVVVKEMTSEQAEHFAADLGESAVPVKAGKNYELVATSVRVPRG